MTNPSFFVLNILKKKKMKIFRTKGLFLVNSYLYSPQKVGHISISFSLFHENWHFNQGVSRTADPAC